MTAPLKPLKLRTVTVQLDPFLCRGLFDLADRRGTRISETLRDVIYTALYQYFREERPLLRAPVPAIKGHYFANMPRLRGIPERGFFEVDSYGLPCQDEPLEADAIAAITQRDGAGIGLEPLE